MNNYVIVTDSSIDLPAQMVEEMGLVVAPLRFTFGQETFEDRPDCRDMAIEDFYQRLREGELPTTSAVNVGDYHAYLTPLLKEGKDILILAFSSGLSATYQSAAIAAQELREAFPERKILAVDTLCASMGQGLLLWLAAQKKREGLSLEALRDWVEENKLRVIHWVVVNDLDHLKRGGRISATTAFVGGLLSIKPIIHLDPEGKLVNVAKVRGRTASLNYLVEKMMELSDPKEGQTVFISHSDCLSDAQYVGELLKEKGLAKDVVYHFIGPVIGAHTGPGTVAVFCMGRER